MDRNLKGRGEFDYDSKNDILLFKVREREYSHSLELSNLVIDFDEESFIVGLQIFNASKTFNLTKEQLRGLKDFQMNCSINEGAIKVNVVFNMIVRNKPVIYHPIIFERVGSEVPNSEMTCQVN